MVKFVFSPFFLVVPACLYINNFCSSAVTNMTSVCQGTPDFTSELRRLPPSTFYFFQFLTLHPSLSLTPSIILRTITPTFPPTSDLFLLGHSDLVVLFPYFLIWFHFYYLISFHPLFNYLLFLLTPFWVLKPSSLSRGPYPFLLGPPAR